MGPAVHEGMSRIVIDLLRGHRADDRYVVCDLGDVREHVRNLLPRFPMLAEGELRSQAFQFFSLQLGDRLTFGDRGGIG